MPSRPGSSRGRNLAAPAAAGAAVEGRGGGAVIDKLDYRPGRPLLRADDGDDDGESAGRASGEHSYAGSFFEQVAEGILDRDRKRIRRDVLRYLGFAWAIINWCVIKISSR